MGQLVNLEQERLGDEHRKLLDEISDHLRLLSSDDNILEVIKSDLQEIRRKHGEDRRTEISGEELGDIDLEDLITEETMVVSISHSGYIKRTPPASIAHSVAAAKDLKGATTEDEDPIEHLFVASTHAYLLFLPTKAKCTGKRSMSCRSWDERAAAGPSSIC